MSKNEYVPGNQYKIKADDFSATPVQYDSMIKYLVEEYALMGFNKEMIIAIFKSPYYRLPYSIYQAKGDEYVVAKVNESMSKWKGNLS